MTIPAPFEHRPDINGLRAVAVLLVVLYHVGVPHITGGFVGVDVFFVISGYLITSLLVLEAERTGHISLADFYARRVRRLFPALMLVVLATLIMGAIWLLPVFGEQVNLAKSAIATSTYLSNVYFWIYTGGYFDGPADLEPLLHTWSLAVEEQFYLVWPLLVMGVVWWRRHDTAKLRSDLLKVIVLAAVVSLALCVWSTHVKPRQAYYLMPPRAWEFAIGGLLALLLPGREQRSRWGGSLLSACGLLAVVASAFYLDRRSSFPGFNALVPTLGAGAVIAGGVLNRQALGARFLTLKPMTVIGLLSYSWYLWHWPLLAITRAVALEKSSLPRDAALGAVALLAAALTYRFIENPVRTQRPGPFAKTWSTLGAGAAISIFMALCAAALGASTHYTSKEPRYSQAMIASRDTPPLRKACHYDAPFKGLADRKQCTFGDPEHIEALLWGDSHADHLSGLMQAFVADQGAGGIMQRSFSSCRPLQAQAAEVAQLSPACVKFNAAVEQEISELAGRGLKGVVLSSMWNAFMHDMKFEPSSAFVAADRLSPEEKLRVLTQAVDATVTRLQAQGLRVLLVAPTHIMPRLVPECLARHKPEECAAVRTEVEERRQFALTALKHVQASHPDSVRLWDPLNAICGDRLCMASRDGTAMYTDDLHFSASEARHLLSSAEPDLLWLVRR